MTKRTEKIGRAITNIAKKIGDVSVNQCWLWYHQPKVPKEMLKKD